MKTFMISYEYKQSFLKKELAKASAEKKPQEEQKVQEKKQHYLSKRAEYTSKWTSILNKYNIDSVMKVEDQNDLPDQEEEKLEKFKDEDFTEIQIEVTSHCFSEDEEIIEWETDIMNVLQQQKQNQKQRRCREIRKQKLKKDEVVQSKYKMIFNDFKKNSQSRERNGLTRV